MKLAYITGFYPEIGGPFSAAKILLTKLAEAGVEVSVVSPLPAGYDKTKLDFCRDLPYSVDYLSSEMLSSFIPSFSSKWHIKLQELQDKNDVIHLNGLFDYYSVLAPFLLKKPYVISVHGSLIKEAFQSGFIRRIKKSLFMAILGNRIVNSASLVHVMCELELKNLLKCFPKLKNSIKVVPNGVDCSVFRDTPLSTTWSEKYSKVNGNRYILFLGRLHPIKGLELLLAAFKILSADKNLYLMFAGPDAGGYSQRLKVLSEKADLKNRIIFTGMLDEREKVSALKMADVFVLPSFSENFGVAVVEAMACGTPVVISDKVGISREVEKYQAGVVVGPNPASIAGGIRSLLNNKEFRSKVSKNGRHMVEEYYDAKNVSNCMKEVYESLL